MTTRSCVKLVHEGEYVAEVDPRIRSWAGRSKFSTPFGFRMTNDFGWKTISMVQLICFIHASSLTGLSLT